MRRFQAVISTVKLVANLSNMVKLTEGWPPESVLSSIVPKETGMPLIYLAVAALAVGLEQLVQWKYGPMGIIAFLALTLGIKARNTMISGIGAVILVMLLAH